MHVPRPAKDRRRELEPAAGEYRRKRRYYKNVEAVTGKFRWEVDSGEDAPLTNRDFRILLAWGAGIVVFAVIVAAAWTYLR